MAEPLQPNYASILSQMQIDGYNKALDWIHLRFDDACDRLLEFSQSNKNPYLKGYHDAAETLQDIVHILTKNIANGNS